jgi:hypothetical protein
LRERHRAATRRHAKQAIKAKMGEFHFHKLLDRKPYAVPAKRPFLFRSFTSKHYNLHDRMWYMNDE